MRDLIVVLQAPHCRNHVNGAAARYAVRMRCEVMVAVLLGGMAVAQSATQTAPPQTGVILRRPGEPLRGPVAVPVPPPKPNLAPPILANFTGTILLRRETGIFIVRGGEKSARQVLND